MSELWLEGVNRTADAVVIDQARQRILLIRRKDTGEWALTGGFVDSTDSSTEETARREALEEADIELASMGRLIYHGIVDDPRNTERAWIETSAYIFTADSENAVNGLDDAAEAVWHDLQLLPNLYASHASIVERAIDNIWSEEKIMTIQHEISATITPVDGGHMQYDKYLVDSDKGKLFVKAHTPEAFTDNDKSVRSLIYLQKEAHAMTHLRAHGFTALPAYSVMSDAAVSMEAFHPDDGWKWRAPPDELSDYVDAAIETFTKLESIDHPTDNFAIEATLESMRKEGWHGFTPATYEKLGDIFEKFLPRLNASTRHHAEKLFEDLHDLHAEAMKPRPDMKLVLSHHDARQSNIAWHPHHGMRVVDWSWAGYGEPGSDITNLLIDLHKSGHDVSKYERYINHSHCLRLIGFLLGHATWPVREGENDTVRFQQFTSAVSAYEVMNGNYNNSDA